MNLLLVLFLAAKWTLISYVFFLILKTARYFVSGKITLWITYQITTKRGTMVGTIAGEFKIKCIFPTKEELDSITMEIKDIMVGEIPCHVQILNWKYLWKEKS